MSLDVKSRAQGSIWGVCVCDALGGPVQFSEPGSFKPLAGMEPVTPFGQPAGSYSDDGSMTLALAQSFIDSEGTYNHALCIHYFLSWIRKGHFSTMSYAWDVGLSTRASLNIWQTRGTENPEHTQREIDRSMSAENRSGNGSLMRIAPVGVMMWRDAREAVDTAVRQGAVTHPALACREACGLYTDLISRVMRGDNKEQLCWAIPSHKLTHQALSGRMAAYETLADWVKKEPDDMKSSGWVVDTLEVALWGLFKYDSFAEGALAVVNRGGDSDTAGAVYGGIAGAFYGYESIPTEWIEKMQNKRFIRDIATKFGDRAAR